MQSLNCKFQLKNLYKIGANSLKTKALKYPMYIGNKGFSNKHFDFERSISMNNSLHIVLGGSGTIGQAVISELKEKKLNIRAIQRKCTIEGVENIKANLYDLNQAKLAIKGGDYVYLCTAVPYSTKLWKTEWPKLVSNVIAACEEAGARLIFLDNIYMYGPVPLRVPFTEEHSQEPVSQKGKVRKIVADMILKAHQEGRIKAVIGRSADFYGPSISSSLYISFLEKMLAGKAPQSLGGVDVVHTYAFTADNGRALVALALDENTYGQVWHLPVSPPVTAKEITSIFNKVLDSNFKVSQVPRLALTLLSLVVPTIKEVKEMLYQFDNPYVMSDEKFKKHFVNFKVTQLEDGLKQMVEGLKKY